MERKLDDPHGNGGPCWEDYPPLLTIAQAGHILQVEQRGVGTWLAKAGLIITLSARRRRVDKEALRAHLATLGSDQ